MTKLVQRAEELQTLWSIEVMWVGSTNWGGAQCFKWGDTKG